MWGRKLVGKYQAKRFILYSNKLKMTFNQAKDYQRIKQEDSVIISTQFKLIEETKAKYSIYNNNMHNFNKTGF